METKEGKKTTEWLAVLLTVATVISTAGGAMLSSLDKTSVLYVIIACLVSMAGVVATYIKGRSDVKRAASFAAAEDPTKP